jgi:hypothetical protein
MTINVATVSRILPLTALMLGACVSQGAYNQLQGQNQQLQAQLAQSQAEQKFIEAGDMLFPEGASSSAKPVKWNLQATSFQSCGICRTPKSSSTDTLTIHQSDRHCSARAFPTIWFCRRAAPPRWRPI